MTNRFPDIYVNPHILYRHGHRRVLRTKEMIVSPCPLLSDFSSGLFQFPGYLKPSLLKYYQLLQLVHNCQPIFRRITRLPAGPRLERGFNALFHWQGGSPACCDEGLTTHLPPAPQPGSQHWGCRTSCQALQPPYRRLLCLALSAAFTVSVPESCLSSLPILRASVLQESFGEKGHYFLRVTLGLKCRCPSLPPCLLLCSES